MNLVKAKHFDGLNALRFVAASLVLVHHSEGIKAKYGLASLQFSSFFQLGSQAVSFFFVLSGFLITYLLQVELANKQTIAIKNFYLRRALRIWPLYFLLVLIGLFILPACIRFVGYDYQMPYQTSQVIGYFTLFLPMVVNLKFGHHFLEPLWSIGVEELFYLLWAPFVFIFARNLGKAILLFFLAKLGLNLAAPLLFTDQFTIDLIHTLKFEEMALGSLFSMIFFRKNAWLSALLYAKTTQLMALAYLVLRCLFHLQALRFSWYATFFALPAISDLFTAFSFATLILNVACNPESLVKLRSKTLNKLGDYSYGIYMYHMLIIFVTMLLIKALKLPNGGSLFHVAYYAFVFSLVILVAKYSKLLIEDPFLKLKRYVQ